MSESRIARMQGGGVACVGQNIDTRERSAGNEQHDDLIVQDGDIARVRKRIDGYSIAIRRVTVPPE